LLVAPACASGFSTTWLRKQQVREAIETDWFVEAGNWEERGDLYSFFVVNHARHNDDLGPIAYASNVPKNRYAIHLRHIDVKNNPNDTI